MENKEYQAIIKFKKEFTDERFLLFVNSYNNGEMTFKDWIKYLESLKPGKNPLVDRLVDFILSYDEGKLFPEKYGYGDPVKFHVTPKAIEEWKGILAFPCSGVTLKKLRSAYFFLDNTSSHNLVYDIDSGRMKHAVNSSIYSFLLTIFLNKRSSFSINYLERFVDDICNSFDTDYAYVFTGQNQLVYDYSKSDLYTHLGLDFQDSYTIRNCMDWILWFYDSGKTETELLFQDLIKTSIFSDECNPQYSITLINILQKVKDYCDFDFYYALEGSSPQRDISEFTDHSWCEFPRVILSKKRIDTTMLIKYSGTTVVNNADIYYSDNPSDRRRRFLITPK